MNCFFSSGAFTAGNLREILAQALRHGLEIELSSALSPLDGEDMAALHRFRQSARLLVHNYFPPPDAPFVLNLGSTDPETLEKSLQLCRRAIELCAEFGVPFYSVHAGFALHLTPGDLGRPDRQKTIAAGSFVSREAAYGMLLASVRELAAWARGRNVRLLLENNVTSAANLDAEGQSPLLLDRPREIAGFLGETADLGVGLLLDVGHAKVTATTYGFQPQEYFESLRPFIQALHLSDNDGLRDSNLPFELSAWFVPFLQQHADKAMVIEAYSLTTEAMLAQRQLLWKLLSE